MTGRWYGVTSAEVGATDAVTDDGAGPMEYWKEFYYVKARTARRAKVLAVRAWRRQKAAWLRDVENPFSGMKTYRMDEPDLPDLVTDLTDSPQLRSA